jgi:hypothetical protein
VVLDVDSWVLVAAGSSALLQPANNAKVTKPVAIIALVFIVVSYYLSFCLGFLYQKNFKVNIMLTHEWLYFAIKWPFFCAVSYLHSSKDAVLDFQNKTLLSG